MGIRLCIAVVGESTKAELSLPTNDLILLYNLARAYLATLNVMMQLAEQSLDMNDLTMQSISRAFNAAEDTFAAAGLRVVEGDAVGQGEGK